MTEAPEKIYGWMDSQLSIARHYGGCTFRGHSYKIDYNDIDQPLVRQDVVIKTKKEKKLANKVKNTPKTIEQFLEGLQP